MHQYVEKIVAYASAGAAFSAMGYISYPWIRKGIKGIEIKIQEHKNKELIEFYKDRFRYKLPEEPHTEFEGDILKILKKFVTPEVTDEDLLGGIIRRPIKNPLRVTIVEVLRDLFTNK